MLRDGADLRVKEVDLERDEGWLGRYDDAVVLFGKVVPGLHSLVSVPAGMLRMLLWRFSLLTALGAAVWDALLLGAGWYLGANWERVAGVVGPVSAAVLAVALVAVAFPAIGWWGRRGG